jgi:hypothetical protein
MYICIGKSFILHLVLGGRVKRARHLRGSVGIWKWAISAMLKKPSNVCRFDSCLPHQLAFTQRKSLPMNRADMQTRRGVSHRVFRTGIFEGAPHKASGKSSLRAMWGTDTQVRTWGTDTKCQRVRFPAPSQRTRHA